MTLTAPSPKCALKWPGSKWKLAPWIAEALPVTKTYLEPFAGSAAVLFNRRRSEIECLNDMDGDICNLYRVLRDREKRDRLIEQIEFTPWAREEFNVCQERDGDDVEQARRFLVRSWQCHGARTGDKRGGWRRLIGTEESNDSFPWQNVPDRLSAAAERLRCVQIENRDFAAIMTAFARPHVTIYLDPPYHPDTMKDGAYYRHILTREQHTQLLGMCLKHPGPLAISGYRHPEYDDAFASWRRMDFSHRAESTAPRIECVWLNPSAVRGRSGLFDEMEP